MRRIFIFTLMKISRYLLLSVFIFLFSISNAQTDSTLLNPNEKVKTGWNFGILPAVSYDTDLGFQYGGLINLYQYGDGSRYPQYNHSLYLEASAYTKGSGLYRFAYDSDKLIPNIQLTLDVSYIPNHAYNFFGFNGYEAVYNPEWEDDTEPPDVYKSRVFYRYQNKMFRFKTDFQGTLSGKKIRWLAGFEFYNFQTDSVDTERLNKGKSGDELLPTNEAQPGLYDRYVAWGLIPEEHAYGGSFTELKAGLVYDTRDNKPNPMRGIWSEIIFVVAPSFLGKDVETFTQLSITHRQYFTLVRKKLSFAYRLGYQTTLFGEVPFYAKPLILTSMLRGATNEGLGGKSNLRGIPRGRVIGDGVVYGNFEVRWKFLYTHWFRQNFYFGLNAFTDVGRVTKFVPIEEKVNAIDDPGFVEADYFDFGAESFHISYGLGLRIAMNQNFIIAFDYGLAADKRDGKSGMYIGLNYLF
jgi:outer membrane protein assembly factor BamA